jgi:hypothetical protein
MFTVFYQSLERLKNKTYCLLSLIFRDHVRFVLDRHLHGIDLELTKKTGDKA